MVKIRNHMRLYTHKQNFLMKYALFMTFGYFFPNGQTSKHWRRFLIQKIILRSRRRSLKNLYKICMRYGVQGLKLCWKYNTIKFCLGSWCFSSFINCKETAIYTRTSSWPKIVYTRNRVAYQSFNFLDLAAFFTYMAIKLLSVIWEGASPPLWFTKCETYHIHST